MKYGDNEFEGYLELAFDLDWKDYNLTLVGSLTGSESSNDIDCVITGDYNPEHLKYLMNALMQFGPFDVYYTTHENAIQWDEIVPQPIRFNIAKPVDRSVAKARARKGGVWSDGLYWLNISLPNKKMVDNNRYNKPISLIQNGQQLYF